MRTKTLLLTAALGAAGIATSMAQVYSVNAVGYVNTTLLPGYNLISNPLNNTAGNTIANLFGTGWNGTIPPGTFVYYFNPTTDSYVIAQWDDLTGSFEPPTSGAQVVPPGQGVFVLVGGTANATVTFVGEVPQGTASNTQIPQGFSIIASTVPAGGPINAPAPGLNFPAVDGDTVYEWNATTDSYVINTFDSLVGGWSPSVPNIDVGEAFWVNKVAATPWNRNFSVNP
jgi:hypothetical protein